MEASLLDESRKNIMTAASIAEITKGRDTKHIIPIYSGFFQFCPSCRMMNNSVIIRALASSMARSNSDDDSFPDIASH
jgi:hypothetical protein